jgi:hypothetical protein
MADYSAGTLKRSAPVARWLALAPALPAGVGPVGGMGRHRRPQRYLKSR